VRTVAACSMNACASAQPGGRRWFHATSSRRRWPGQGLESGQRSARRAPRARAPRSGPRRSRDRARAMSRPVRSTKPTWRARRARTVMWITNCAKFYARTAAPDCRTRMQSRAGVKYLTEFRDWKGQRSTNSMGTPRTMSASMVQRARDDVMPVTVDLMARTYGGRRRPECQICEFQ
jgi:hypothetical protein